MKSKMLLNAGKKFLVELLWVFVIYTVLALALVCIDQVLRHAVGDPEEHPTKRMFMEVFISIFAGFVLTLIAFYMGYYSKRFFLCMKGIVEGHDVPECEPLNPEDIFGKNFVVRLVQSLTATFLLVVAYALTSRLIDHVVPSISRVLKGLGVESSDIIPWILDASSSLILLATGWNLLLFMVVGAICHLFRR